MTFKLKNSHKCEFLKFKCHFWASSVVKIGFLHGLCNTSMYYEKDSNNWKNIRTFIHCICKVLTVEVSKRFAVSVSNELNK